MLISKEVEIKWHYSNRAYYTEKGYEFTNMGDVFVAKFDDVLHGGKQNIIVKCDYQQKGCEDEYKVKIKDYYKNNVYANIHKDCCHNPNCIKLKRKESVIKKYGVDSIAKLQSTKDVKNKTNQIKYGGNSPMCNDKIKEKSVNTLQEKYGVKNISQVEEIKTKKQNTLLENYGVTNPRHNEEIINKSKQTSLEKYNHEYYTQTDEYKERVKITNQEKYGVDWYLQLDNPREKGKKVLLDKYGVEYGLQSKEIQQKIQKSLYENNTAPRSNQQTYICNLYNAELNYLVKNCFLDIAFVEDRIYCEYQGSGHELQVLLGDMNQEEFNQKEQKRGYFLANKGWKRVEIISTKDKIPSDEILLEMLDYAKQYISTGHSWIKFDIDNGTVITSQYTNPYNYGTLRKITKKDIA